MSRGAPGAVVLLLLLLAVTIANSSDDSAWARSYDAATAVRFIPVELWTGGDWDGAHVIRMPGADLSFGGGKRIGGPFAWTPPGGGDPIQVYERVNRGKRQLFALAPDGSGLGRVYDSRYSRSCPGEVKFPLGHWRQGEVRHYTLRCHGGTSRRLRVTIEAIDFTHATVPHSLRFHWLMDEGRGAGTDMRYTYSPRQGLVHVHGNE